MSDRRRSFNFSRFLEDNVCDTPGCNDTKTLLPDTQNGVRLLTKPKTRNGGEKTPGSGERDTIDGHNDCPTGILPVWADMMRRNLSILEA